MTGENNLSLKSIEKFAKAMKLGKEEAVFFRNLVLFNQATTSAEKQRYAEEIMRSRGYRRQHPLSESQFNYFKQWYLPLIRELPCLSDFKEDAEWIAQRITPQITPQEAQRALNELLKLGLLKPE